MRKVGIYYAYWFKDWDVDVFPLIKKVKDLGFDQLEINGGSLVNMTSLERNLIVEEANKQNITLSYGIGLISQFDVSSLDETIRLAGIDYMSKIIKAIGSMGGGTLCGSVYTTWPKQLPKGTQRIEYYNQSVKSMKILAPIAEKENVILLCEVLNRFEQFILNNCDQALEYVKEINNPSCKILLDTFHMNIEEDSISDAIVKAGKYLGGLHLGENNRRPVGLGNMPWDDIKIALDKIDFQGALVEEPFIKSGGQVGQDIAVWRDLMKNPDLDKLAKDSAVFIRKTLC